MAKHLSRQAGPLARRTLAVEHSAGRVRNRERRWTFPIQVFSWEGFRSQRR